MQRENIVTFFQNLKSNENLYPYGASIDEMLKTCTYANSFNTNLFISHSKLPKLTLQQLYSCFLKFTKRHPTIKVFQECLFPFFCHAIIHFRLNDLTHELNDFKSLYLDTIISPFREKVDEFLDNPEIYHRLSLSFSTQLYILRCHKSEYDILNSFLNIPENMSLKRYIAQIITIELIQEKVKDKLPYFIFPNKSPTSNLNVLQIKLNSSASLILPELPLIYVSVNDNQICHIDTSKQALQHLYSHPSFVTSMSLSSQSELLLSTDLRGTAILYSKSLDKEKIKVENNLRRINLVSPIWCSTFAPLGGYFALGSDDRIIRLYDAPTQKISRSLIGHTERIESVLFHPNCSLLGSLSYDAALRIWDIRSGETCRLFLGEACNNSGLSISPNGQYAAFFDGRLKICDIGKGEFIIDAQLDNIKSVESTYFSADTNYLYAVGSEGTIMCINLFDNHTPTEIYRLDSNVVSSRFLKSGDLVIVTPAET